MCKSNNINNETKGEQIKREMWYEQNQVGNYYDSCILFQQCLSLVMVILTLSSLRVVMKNVGKIYEGKLQENEWLIFFFHNLFRKNGSNDIIKMMIVMIDECDTYIFII